MRRIGLLILFILHDVVVGVRAEESKPKDTKLDKELAELAKKESLERSR